MLEIQEERGEERKKYRVIELMEAEKIVLTQGECLDYLCTVALRIYL